MDHSKQRYLSNENSQIASFDETNQINQSNTMCQRQTQLKTLKSKDSTHGSISSSTFQPISRKEEVSQNNFMKKMKVMSKSHTKLTVKSLHPPQIKTDI